MNSLAANTSAFVATALVLNGLIYVLGWGGPGDRVEPFFAPPGWFIGGVWILLFALMGVARWAVLREGERKPARWIALFGLFCALYPVYTLGLSNLPIALVGNLATLGASGWLAWHLRATAPLATGVFSAIVGWVIFATVLTVRTMQLN